MKKIPLTHLIWATVATSTFFIGTKVTSPNPSKQESQNSTRPSAYSSTSSRLKNPNRSSPRQTRSSSSLIQRHPTSQKLSEAEIENLGRDLNFSTTPLARREIFNQLLASLTTENAQLIRSQIVKLGPESSEFRDFHYQWGAITGLEAVENGHKTPERDFAITLAGWTANQPDAALTYFEQLEPNEQKDRNRLWGTIYGLSNNDPHLAVSFIENRTAAGDEDATRYITSSLKECFNLEHMPMPPPGPPPFLMEISKIEPPDDHSPPGLLKIPMKQLEKFLHSKTLKNEIKPL